MKKHPDSSRQRKARLRSKSYKLARVLKVGINYE
jgi:hypothetical protein